MPPRRKKSRVVQFNDYVVATGGRPMLRVPDQRLIGGRLDVKVTLASATVVAVDLANQAVYDRRVRNLYGTGATSRLEAGLRLAGYRLYINAPTWRSELNTLKMRLDDASYLHVVRKSQVLDLEFRGALHEPATQFDFKQAAAANEERTIIRSAPRWLDRPIQVDLRSDTIEFRIDEVIAWAGGPMQAYVQFFGHLGPRDLAGVMASDVDTCAPVSIEDTNESVGPETFGNLTVNGFGTSLLSGPDQIFGT